MADRPARPEAEPSGTEIEITPEMIEAAVAVMYGFRLNDYDEDELKRCAAAVLRIGRSFPR